MYSALCDSLFEKLERIKLVLYVDIEIIKEVVRDT